VKWPVRIPFDRLWPDRPVQQTALVAGLVLLKRADIPGPTLQPTTDTNALINELLSINCQEAGHYLELLHKAAVVLPNEGWRAQWQERERALLSAFIQDIPTYLLELPNSPRSADTFRRELLTELAKLVPQTPQTAGTDHRTASYGTMTSQTILDGSGRHDSRAN